WLFARKHGGTFILRLEDTDADRTEEHFVHAMCEGFKWLGIDWDEGPFFQSKRLQLYTQAVNRLLEEQKAYKCFCSPEELETQREQLRREGKAFVYSGKCRSRSTEEIVEMERRGVKPAIRLKVDTAETVRFTDLVFGEIEMSASKFGDLIIMRSDGMPTYNLAVVIDDYEMRITHVIRGDDHISNTPKQILLYRALGYPPPQFAHLPLILGPDRTRLSKRHGATSVLELRQQGFLPEAVMNYLALLGWAPDETTQIMNRTELISRFTLERVSRSAAIFDIAKLEWMNGYYMRNLPPEQVINSAIEYMAMSGLNVHRFNREWLEGVIRLEIERSKTLAEMYEHLCFFFEDNISYEPAAVTKFLSGNDADFILLQVTETLTSVSDFSQISLEKALRELSAKLNISFSKVVHPLRVALTGRTASPGIFDVLHFLGKERVLQRLEFVRKNIIRKN
ncbi:MAG: glutamate--tRNA ligase, partial [Candidatus Sumerlaeia bacterium]|nr:glutamate--tRNA ligase [Candidatus Sumerlaeia bacterium]